MTFLARISSQLCHAGTFQLTACRTFSYSKEKRKKKYKKQNDMSWSGEIVERWKNPPQYPQEPAKLHMVELVSVVHATPDKRKTLASLLSLGFGEDPKLHTKVVVKNTHDVNNTLYKLKHILRITPVTFPYGEPTEDCDLEKSFLRDNGEFVVVRNVTPQEDEPQVVAEREESRWQMDRDTLVKHCRQTLEEYRLNEEFFKEEPVYKYNQDGKEHRYFGDKRMYGRKTWY